MIRKPNEGHGLMPWGRGGESTPPRHNPGGKKIEARTKMVGAACQKHTRGSKNVAGCALRTAARLLRQLLSSRAPGWLQTLRHPWDGAGEARPVLRVAVLLSGNGRAHCAYGWEVVRCEALRSEQPIGATGRTMTRKNRISVLSGFVRCALSVCCLSVCWGGIGAICGQPFSMADIAMIIGSPTNAM